MIGFYLALNYHIIDVNLNVFPQLRLKHPSHHPLIGSPYILQTKGHHLIMVISSISDESYPLLVIQS